MGGVLERLVDLSIAARSSVLSAAHVFTNVSTAARSCNTHTERYLSSVAVCVRRYLSSVWSTRSECTKIQRSEKFCRTIVSKVFERDICWVSESGVAERAQ